MLATIDEDALDRADGCCELDMSSESLLTFEEAGRLIILARVSCIAVNGFGILDCVDVISCKLCSTLVTYQLNSCY